MEQSRIQAPYKEHLTQYTLKNFVVALAISKNRRQYHRVTMLDDALAAIL